MPIISSLSAGARAFGLYVLTALVSVIDTFNRSDSASDLGSAAGQKWKIWKGIWGIATNKASSSTTASTYPVATLTFTKNDVSIGIGGPTPGTGTNFWLSDGDNWWAAVYDEVYTCQTCSSSSCISNTCPVDKYNCNIATCQTGTCSPNNNCSVNNLCSIWTYNCNVTYRNSTCNIWSTFRNSTCNAWNTWRNSACTTWSTFRNSTCNAWSAPCNAWSSVNKACTTWSRPCTTWGWGCGACGPFYTCNATGWGCANCGPFTACNATGWGCANCGPFYTCNATGWGCANCGPFCSNNNNSFCSTWACNIKNCETYVCNQYLCSNNNTCNSWSCIQWQTSYFSCNCTTDKKINIIKSIAGVVTTVTGSVFTGTIASFKAFLSGNNITVKAYSSGDYTSQIGSDFIIDATGASKAKNHGIIKSPATNNQGSTIDEFRVD